jgi:four helix bundle protein
LTWNENQKNLKIGCWTLRHVSAKSLTRCRTHGFGRHIAGQLVRSGTSPAPNYAEACAAESKRDFIHKLGIALKELRESRTWIKLILKADLLQEPRMSPLLDETQQLCNIVGKSIVTAKANQQQDVP